jgi:hypothetical protein
MSKWKYARRTHPGGPDAGDNRKVPIPSRVLIAGWGIYFLGVTLLLVFPRHLVRRWTIAVLIVLSLVLVAASIVYAFAVAYRQAVKRHRDILQGGIAGQKTGDRGWRPAIERGLAVGWALFVVSAGVGFLFPQSRWSPGPESLLALCTIVALSSLAYAAYLVLQQFMKRLRR